MEFISFFKFSVYDFPFLKLIFNSLTATRIRVAVKIFILSIFYSLIIFPPHSACYKNTE